MCAPVRLSESLFSSASISDTEPAKKASRQIAVSTFEKWQRNYDQEHQTLTWLRRDKDKRDKGLVAFLWCSVPRQDLLYEDLFKCMGDWDGKPSDEQPAGRRCV